MIHEILWETFFSLNVVFCRAGHTREILESTRNQVPLRNLIMPFSSRDEHEVVILAYLQRSAAHSCLPSLPPKTGF